MTVDSLPYVEEADKSSRSYWVAAALEFIIARKGIAGAEPDEFIAGYLDGFRGVYCKAKRLDGCFRLYWFVTPNEGKAQRIAQKLMSDLYLDHEGNVFEFPSRWALILGSVVRLGDEPLLTLDMVRGER